MSVNVYNRVFWTDMPPLPYTTKGGKHQRVSPPIAKIVLLAIADSADDFGENSYNSYETISRKASITRRSAMRATKALTQNDYLRAKGLSKYGTINFSVIFDLLGDPPKGRAKAGRPSKKDAEFMDELDDSIAETSDSETETSDSEAETSDSEAETSDSEAETSDPESPYPSLTSSIRPLTSSTPPPKTDEEVGQAYKFFEENIGPLTPYLAETLGELIDIHKSTWVIEAMKIAVKDQVRKIKYFTAILDRWQKEGYGEPKKTRSASHNVTKQLIKSPEEDAAIRAVAAEINAGA